MTSTDPDVQLLLLLNDPSPDVWSLARKMIETRIKTERVSIETRKTTLLREAAGRQDNPAVRRMLLDCAAEAEMAIGRPREPPAITDGSEKRLDSIDIHTVATEMGHGQAWIQANRCEIGKIMAKKYRARYNGRNPEQKPKLVDNDEIMVNCYTSADRDLMEQAIRERAERPRAGRGKRPRPSD